MTWFCHPWPKILHILEQYIWFQYGFKNSRCKCFFSIIKLSSVKSKDYFDYFQKSKMNKFVYLEITPSGQSVIDMSTMFIETRVTRHSLAWKLQVWLIETVPLFTHVLCMQCMFKRLGFFIILLYSVFWSPKSHYRCSCIKTRCKLILALN